MPAERSDDYQSYLLRLWRAPNRHNMAWRASLEDPHTGERRGFASLDALVAFLRERTGEPTVPETRQYRSNSGD